MRCTNCEDRWRLVLAQQFNTNNMKDKNKPSDLETNTGDSGSFSFDAPTPKLEPTQQAAVPPLRKPDVNKIIEDRRKDLQNGKVIKK